MRFADWFKQQQETATSTGDIAHFARPTIVSQRRLPLSIDELEEKKNAKNKKNLQKL